MSFAVLDTVTYRRKEEVIDGTVCGCDVLTFRAVVSPFKSPSVSWPNACPHCNLELLKPL